MFYINPKPERMNGFLFFFNNYTLVRSSAFAMKIWEKLKDQTMKPLHVATFNSRTGQGKHLERSISPDQAEIKTDIITFVLF